MVTHFVLSNIITLGFIVLTTFFAWKAHRTTRLSKMEKGIIMCLSQSVFSLMIFQPANMEIIAAPFSRVPSKDIFHEFLGIFGLALITILLVVSIAWGLFYSRTKECIFKYAKTPFINLTPYDKRALKFLITTNILTYALLFVAFFITLNASIMLTLPLRLPLILVVLVMFAWPITFLPLDILSHNQDIEKSIDAQFRLHYEGKIYTGIGMYAILITLQVAAMKERFIKDYNLLKAEFRKIKE